MSFGGDNDYRSQILIDVERQGAGAIAETEQEVERLLKILQIVNDEYRSGSRTLMDTIGVYEQFNKVIRRHVAAIESASKEASSSEQRRAQETIAALNRRFSEEDRLEAARLRARQEYESSIARTIGDAEAQIRRDTAQTSRQRQKDAAEAAKAEERLWKDVASVVSAAEQQMAASESAATQREIVRINSLTEGERRLEEAIRKQAAARAEAARIGQEDVEATRASYDAYQRLGAALQRYRDALAGGDRAQVAAATRELRDAEAEYAQASQKAGEAAGNRTRITDELRGATVGLASAKKDLAAEDANASRIAAQAAARVTQAEVQRVKAYQENILAIRDLQAAQLRYADTVDRSGANSGKARGAAQDLANAEARATATANNLANAEDKLAQAYDDATRAGVDGASRAAAAQAGVQAAMQTGNQAAQEMQSRTMAATRSVYFFAQALEDMRYGPMAVLNNIPLVTQSVASAMGASFEKAMAWAGALSIVGTAALVLEPQIRSLWHQFTTAEALAADRSVQNIKQRLEDLTNAPWFIHVDFRDIERLQEELILAERRASAVKAAQSGMTVEQAEAATRAKSALEETAETRPGTTPGFQLGGAVAGAMRRQGTFFTRDEQEQLRRARATVESAPERRKQAFSAEEAIAIEGEIRVARGLIDEINQMAKSRVENDIVGSAQAGEQAAIEQILSLGQQFPGEFAAQGIGPDYFERLREARLGTVQEDLAAGRQAPHVEAQRAAKKADEDRAKDFEKTVQGVVTGVGTKLQDDIDERLAKLAKLNQADERLRQFTSQFVESRLKTAGVAENLVPGATEELTNRAFARFQGRLAGRTGAANRSAAAGEVLAEIAEERRKKAETEQRKVDSAAKKAFGEFEDVWESLGKEAETFAKGFLPQLSEGPSGLAQAVRSRLDRGQDIGQVVSALAPQVASRIAGAPDLRGDRGLIADVAAEVVRQQAAKVAPEAARDGGFDAAMAEDAAKFDAAQRRQGRASARDRQEAAMEGMALRMARDNGMAPEAALNVVRQMFHMQQQFANRQARLEAQWALMQADYGRFMMLMSTQRGNFLNRRFPQR